jgi:predicted transposase YbfD/YdcC
MKIMVEKLVNVETIGCYFESLSDPRHSRNRKHLLVDIIVITICGMICGSDGPTAIHRWAMHRREWLQTFLELPEGIPSRDCIRRLLLALQPSAFQKCFQEWLTDALQTSPEGRLIRIDGKTCRGSHDGGKSLGALHIVSAWASEEGLALGQVATDDRSNEITAIPELLSHMNLQGAVVTIDAIGTQKEITKQIVDRKGDYVLVVKNNQPKLRAAIHDFFAEHLNRNLEDLQYRYHETTDDGHGRIDERSYYLTKIPADFPLKKEWPTIKAIGYSLRITRTPDGREVDTVRYYILSRYLSGKRFSEAVRGHWSIESLHWLLDVTFREDDSRTRERTLANNLSWLRRFAVSLLKRHPVNDSIRGKMIRCLMDNHFLSEVLAIT